MKKRILTIIVLFALILTMGGGIFFSALTVRAEGVNNYSGPLADLGRDESFDKSRYPLVVGDKSLGLIQVAEGSQNELYIYVYQPGGTTDIQASSINISKEYKDLNYKNYTLTLVGQEGVFHKYLVNGFTVSSDDERYYEITSIYRPALDIDGENTTDDDNGNTITEVSYAVSKSFRLTDDSVYVEDIDVIAITDKFVGFMRYPKGTFLFPGDDDIDVHFVAFSTDKRIDKLLEADVFYTRQSFSLTGMNGVETYGEKVDDYAYLKLGDVIEYNGTGWFSNDYCWNVIESVEDFFESETVEKVIYNGRTFDVINTDSKLTEESKENIFGKEWVLRFTHTDYRKKEMGNTVPYTNYYYTIIGNVSILRLSFETDDIYYNLGVVDNKQSGDDIPDNDTSGGLEIKFDDDFKIGLSIFLLLIAGFLVLSIWDRILPLFEALLDILLTPFRIIFGIGKRKK